MEKIIQNLKTPEWWFSAFIVAVFASLVAGWLRDAIPRWTFSISHRMRRRRIAYLRRQVVRIRLMRQQPALLSAVGVSILLQTVHFLAFLFIVGSIPMVSEFYAQHPELQLWHLTSPDRARHLAPFVSFVCMLYAIPTMYQLPRATQFYHRAFKAVAGRDWP